MLAPRECQAESGKGSQGNPQDFVVSHGGEWFFGCLDVWYHDGILLDVVV